MPWLSISRGDKDYFAFPSKDSYVQLNWSQNVSGVVRNLIAAEYEGKEYLPKYYYAGGLAYRILQVALQGLKSEAITENTETAIFSLIFLFSKNISLKI